MSVEDYELGAALVCAGARAGGRNERAAAVVCAAMPADAEQIGEAFRPTFDRIVALIADAAHAIAALPPDTIAALAASGEPTKEQP